MSDNPELVELLKKFGMTHGFKLSQAGSNAVKAAREARETRTGKELWPESSIKISVKSENIQFRNHLTRLKRELGWDLELYEDMERIDSECRSKGVPPKPRLEEHLRTVVCERMRITDPDKIIDQEPEDTNRVVRRHGKGGSVTGTRKATAAKAQPASSPTSIAPVAQVLQTSVRTQLETISPERADWLLNADNLAPYQRPTRDRHIKHLAEVMRRGEFRANPADPLCIDWNGKTANGQHRLWAIIESELSQQMFVMYDVDPALYDIMDQHAKRSVGDGLSGVLQEDGKTKKYKNTAALASVARDLWLWYNVPNQRDWNRQPQVTTAMLETLLEEHPDVPVSVKQGLLRFSMDNKQNPNPSATRSAHYLMTQAMDGNPELPTLWYKALKNMSVPHGSAGHALGMYYLGGAENTTRVRAALDNRRKKELDLYLLISCWNKHCKGEELKKIMWRPDFTIPEPIRPGRMHNFPDFH